MRLTLPALFAAVALATPSHAFLARNGLVVEPSRDGFEIPFRGQSGASDFWCAAGDYVVRKLGLSPGTRIFRTSATPRRSGQGMTFSLSSEGATGTGLAMLGNRRSVSAAHARQLCEVPRLIDE